MASPKREVFFWKNMAMNVETINKVVPKGYSLGAATTYRGYYPNEGVLRREGSEEFFVLTNGSFSSRIDSYFKYLPSALIRIFKEQGGMTTVLDIGGGVRAKAAREVANKHPEIKVISVDLAAPSYVDNNLESRNGDACALPVESSSVRLAYSRQLLPYFEKGNRSKREVAIAEVARVLKPGGVGLVDDDYFTVLHSSDRRLIQLQEELSVEISSRRALGGGRFLLISNGSAHKDISQVCNSLAMMDYAA